MVKKVEKQSLNLLEENKKKLKILFPNVFNGEGKFDLEIAKRVFSLDEKEDNEKYGFTWNGKSDAFRLLQKTTTLTLNPNKEESINFDGTENIFIEGDNLESLRLLQKSYFNKVKMIYIDPPYNTGNDFIYKDNFKNGLNHYLKQTGQMKEGIKMTTNKETNGRFHSDWLNMMYPRLILARNLLRNDGVIFISIDDNEVHNLRMICNEIFGEDNFVANLVWQRASGGGNSGDIVIGHDFILVYQKDKMESQIKFYGEETTRGKIIKQDNETLRVDDDVIRKKFGKYKKGTERRCYYEELKKYKNENQIKEINEKIEKREYILMRQSNGKHFIGEVIKEGTRKILYSIVKGILNKDGKEELADVLDCEETEIPFDNPKPSKLIKILLKSIETDKNDIILDFFAGSGTIGQAVLNLNKEDNGKRKFILIQLPEKIDEESDAYKNGYKTISQIAKERLRKVIKNMSQDKKNDGLDLGFKVFELDKSNYKIWENIKSSDKDRVKKLREQLKLFESALIDNWKPFNVLYEIIIKEGYDLNSKVEEIKEGENTFLRISEGERFFILCLDKEVEEENVEKLKLEKDDLFMCLDEGLTTSKKLNLDGKLILKVI